MHCYRTAPSSSRLWREGRHSEPLSLDFRAHEMPTGTHTRPRPVVQPGTDLGGMSCMCCERLHAFGARGAVHVYCPVQSLKSVGRGQSSRQIKVALFAHHRLGVVEALDAHPIGRSNFCLSKTHKFCADAQSDRGKQVCQKEHREVESRPSQLVFALASLLYHSRLSVWSQIGTLEFSRHMLTFGTEKRAPRTEAVLDRRAKSVDTMHKLIIKMFVGHEKFIISPSMKRCKS